MEQDIKALVDKADQLFFHDQLNKAEEAYVRCLELIDDERGEDYQKALGNRSKDWASGNPKGKPVSGIFFLLTN